MSFRLDARHRAAADSVVPLSVPHRGQVAPGGPLTYLQFLEAPKPAHASEVHVKPVSKRTAPNCRAGPAIRPDSEIRIHKGFRGFGIIAANGES